MKLVICSVLALKQEGLPESLLDGKEGYMRSYTHGR